MDIWKEKQLKGEEMLKGKEESRGVESCKLEGKS